WCAPSPWSGASPCRASSASSHGRWCSWSRSSRSSRSSISADAARDRVMPPAPLNGAELGLIWALPFLGMLLSIALVPLRAPRVWEHHFGTIAFLWAAAFIVPCAIAFGSGIAAGEVLHTIMIEYVPFMILLFALFVVAGGIRIVGNLVGTPGTNVGLL